MGEMRKHKGVNERVRGPTGVNSKNSTFMTTYFESAYDFGTKCQASPMLFGSSGENVSSRLALGRGTDNKKRFRVLCGIPSRCWGGGHRSVSWSQ